MPVRCEGFRGVSQSLGHHIANDSIRDHVLTDERPRTSRSKFEASPYDVSIIGDYNIGGDAWSSRTLLEEMGLRVVAQWSGDGTLAELENTPARQAQPAALLPLDELHLAAHGGEVRHPLDRVQLLRPDQDRRVAAPDRRASSTTRSRKGPSGSSSEYKPEVEAVIAKYRPRLEGKRVMLFVGGLRPRHVIGAYEDLGMEVVGTGYEFGHNDDYDRTLKEMGNATLLYDDVTGYEFEEFVKKIKPDLIGSGIKEKYIFQKMGIPFRQMHSWDYSGPYHGYDGFAIFARDMDMTINNPCWDRSRRRGSGSTTVHRPE